MTEAYRQWPDALFYFSTAGTANALDQLIKLQRAAKHMRTLSDALTVDTNGDEQQDVALGFSLGELGQRHKYRVYYDKTNDRFVVQRNSGSDATKTWVELFRIDNSGNITAAGTLSADSISTTAGGVTLGGVLDLNSFYMRNVDKNVGLFRTDRLRVYGAADFEGANSFDGTSTFEGPVNLRGITLYYSTSLRKAFRYTKTLTSNAQTQLNGKAATSHNHSTSQITSGTFADARIAESNVTQHEDALAIGAKFLGTFTAAAAATLDITSVLDRAVYVSYVIVFDRIEAPTDDDDLWMRTSINNGSSFRESTGDYRHIGTVNTTAAAAVDAGSASDTKMLLNVSASGAGFGNAAGEHGSGVVWIDKLGGSGYRFQCRFSLSYLGSDGVYRFHRGCGLRNSTTDDVNAVRFLMSSGNITARCNVYGFNEV